MSSFRSTTRRVSPLRPGYVRWFVGLLSISSAVCAQPIQWEVAQEPRMPVAGVIREGSGPLVVDTRIGPLVVTETEGVISGDQPLGLIDAVEDRVEFRYPDAPDGQRYVQGPHSAREVSCPGLLQGGRGALPTMTCVNGTLKLHNAFRDTAWLAPPAGYEIAHLSPCHYTHLRKPIKIKGLRRVLTCRLRPE
jgi:hypothetical protein